MEGERGMELGRGLGHCTIKPWQGQAACTKGHGGPMPSVLPLPQILPAGSGLPTWSQLFAVPGSQAGAVAGN